MQDAEVEPTVAFTVKAGPAGLSVTVRPSRESEADAVPHDVDHPDRAVIETAGGTRDLLDAIRGNCDAPLPLLFTITCDGGCGGVICHGFGDQGGVQWWSAKTEFGSEDVCHGCHSRSPGSYAHLAKVTYDSWVAAYRRSLCDGNSPAGAEN